MRMRVTILIGICLHDEGHIRPIELYITLMLFRWENVEGKTEF